LPERKRQPAPAARQGMGVHQLIVLITADPPVIGLGDQAEPGLLAGGIGLGPELVLLDSGIERPRPDRRIGKRVPGNVRGIDQLDRARAAFWGPPLGKNRDLHRITDVVIVLQFFFELQVFVVNIVQKLGDVLHEVGRWCFNFQVDGLLHGLCPRWSGRGVSRAGCRLGHCRVRCECNRDQHRRGPDDRSSGRMRPAM
jgi:hypothetical protein